MEKGIRESSPLWDKKPCLADCTSVGPKAEPIRLLLPRISNYNSIFAEYIKHGNVMFEHIPKINIGCMNGCMAKKICRERGKKADVPGRPRGERAYCRLPTHFLVSDPPQGLRRFLGFLDTSISFWKLPVLLMWISLKCSLRSPAPGCAPYCCCPDGHDALLTCSSWGPCSPRPHQLRASLPLFFPPSFIVL